MRVEFRQGIVEHSRDAAGNQTFLQLTGGQVNLFVNPTPVTVTLADGPKNFLISETVSVPAAWIGPFVGGTEYWLYWDIDLITGEITRGHTTLAPVVSATPPPRIDGQHWFNTTLNEMEVVIGGRFVKRLRVFACKITTGGVITSISDQAPDFRGTQIGNNSPGNHGPIVRDLLGRPFTDPDGRFFTSEEPFVTGASSAAQQRIQTSLVRAEAAVPMSAFTVVEFSSTTFNQVEVANPFVEADRVFGIIDEDVINGDIVNVTIEGIIQNTAWNWTTPNAPLYNGLTGQLTETPVIADQVPVGFVVNRKTVVVRPLSVTQFDGDPLLVTGGTMTGPLILAADPVVGLEAATMNYVDVQVGNLAASAQVDFVNVVGDTMTGFLTLNADPTANLHAATKQYVDTRVDAHAILVNNPHSVTKAQVGLSDVQNILSNFAAVIPPNNNDDVNAGYSVGSLWIDTVLCQTYVCVDNTMNAAKWEQVRQDTDAIWGNITGTLSMQTDLQSELDNKSDITHNHDGTYVQVGGDTMTGFLTLAGDPTNAFHAATMQYVDQEVANHNHNSLYLRLDGSNSPMTGFFDLAGNPTTALQATTKQYVDTQHTAHSTSTANPHSVTKSQVGLGNVDNVLNNYTAVGPPTNTDDTTAGYQIGSFWFDTVAGRGYACVDDTATLAVWVDIGIADVMAVWGQITGTLSNQTDLQTALNNKSDISHNHSGTYVEVAGDTMTGLLVLSGDPVVGLGAATMQYVDNKTWLEADITDLQSYLLPADIGVTVAAFSHGHDTSDVTSGTFNDARIAQSNVTQHEAAIDHDALTNWVANEHVDHTGVTLTAGEGLTGGGDISANRTFALDIDGLTPEVTTDGANDFVVIYDDSASAHRKVLLNNLGVGGGSTFVSLTDTPANYTGAASYFVKVNGTPDALEFVADPGYAVKGTDLMQPEYALLAGANLVNPAAVYATTINVAASAVGRTNHQVFVNGVGQIEGAGKAYTVTTNSPFTISFNAGEEPILGDDIEIYLFGVLPT